MAFFGLLASSGSGLHTHLPVTEKLVVWAHPDASNQTLVISVSNIWPGTTVISNVTFMGVAMPQSAVLASSNFTKTPDGGFQLASGKTGELLIDRSGLNVTAGIQYTIELITEAGSQFPTTITWP